MIDPTHAQRLLTRRATCRKRCLTTLLAAEALWEPLKALEERIAVGETYVANNPRNRKAATLLADLRKQHRDLEYDHEGALAEFVRADESYLLDVRGCRIHELPEEA